MDFDHPTWCFPGKSQMFVPYFHRLKQCELQYQFCRWSLEERQQVLLRPSVSLQVLNLILLSIIHGKKITANVYIIWSLVESYLIRISTPFYFHTTVVYRVNLLEIFSLMILFMLSYKILVRLMFLISSGLKEHFPYINIRLLTFCDNRKWFFIQILFFHFCFRLYYIIP